MLYQSKIMEHNVWPAVTKSLFVTLLLLGTAQQAFAQSSIQQIPQGNPGTTLSPAPPNFQDNTTLYPEAVIPAPRLEPLLTPSEQAARNAYPTATSPQSTLPGIQSSPMGQPVAQPFNSNTPVPQVSNPSAPLTGVGQPIAGGTQNVASGVSSGVADTASTAATSATAGAGAVMGAVGTGVGAAAEGIGASVSGPSNTTGFSSIGSGSNLPLNSGQMPNLGMNMNVDPNLVGGFDPNLPPGASPNANAVPYEIQLEQRNQEIREKARNMAYEQAKKSVLPMETYEIRDVLGRLKDTQEAIQSHTRPAPTPGNVIRTISTDPAAKPRVIRLAAGNVTTLNIIDITGEPWPIVDIGFGGFFDVKPPEAGGHVIRITPLKDFSRGNLVIRLLKMTTPITFSLESGGDTVNYRFDARIPEYGPNAKMPIMGQGITTMAGDRVTTAFLEGTPPTNAEKLVVQGTDARTHAYRFAGSLYVRTPLSLLSPAWQSSATSSDGMNIYVLNDAPVILLSEKGSLVRARISDAKKSNSGF